MRSVAHSLAAALLAVPVLLALAAPAAAQTVSFSSANYAVWEGESAQVEVVLSASRRTDTTVELHPISLSATGQGVDFIDQRITVTIPRYETRGTGAIRTVQDARKEVTEQFRLDIVGSLPAGVTLGAPHPTYVNIQDDDQDAGSLPRLSIARYGKYVPGQTGGFYAPVVEGTAASFSVVVSTDWAAPKELTVSFEVSEDTGEGQDFVASGNEGRQTMTIHPWRDGAAKIFQVPTSGDSGSEADGAVTVRLVPSDDYHVEVGRHWATVEVVDDDHPLGLTLQSSTPVFGGLTMPEGGGGGYTVRLASAPTGNVTVTWTRRDDGDGDGDWSNVHVSPASMTFTRDNWFETQLMYVRGDRDNDGDNDRFSIVHTASGGGYGGISDYMRVGVVEPDIPEVSTPPPDEYVPNDWALKPSGIGAGGRFRLLFLTAARNASDTDIATYNTFVQTEAAGGHAAIQTYGGQFKVVGSTASVSARGNTRTTGAGTGVPIYWLNGAKVADDYNDFWDGSWNAQMSSDTRGASGMAVSGALRVWTGAQTNGGIHSDSLGSNNVRYGSWGSGTNPISQGTDSGSGARRMLAMSPLFEVSAGTGQGSGEDTVAPPQPTASVSNVQVAAVDAASAQVTWDAVEHATSYRVEYESTSALTDQLNYVQRGVNGHTDTSWTFRHDAAEAMTLTVTVTPAYEDGNGDTQFLDDLAGAATIDVGPSGTGSSDSVGDGDGGEGDIQTGHTPPASCVSDEQWKTVKGYYDSNANKSPNYGANWYRVLIAYQQARPEKALPDWEGATAKPTSPYTVAEAEQGETAWSGWTPVREVLECLSSCVSDAEWSTVAGYYASNSGRSPNYGANWYRVLIAYQQERTDKALPAWVGATASPTTAYTVKEAEDSETLWSGWTPVRKVLACLKNAAAQSSVPLLPGGWDPMREGVVRFVNHSAREGEVRIVATDDSGWSPRAVTLQLGPGESVELATRDLERGAVAKGLLGYIGAGTGNWRLDTSSEQDVEVRVYVRSRDGVLAPMDDAARPVDGVRRVPTFHPADHRDQVTSLLRLVNRGDEALAARIVGTDDSGAPGGEVTLVIPAREAVLLSAAELEGGGAGLRGALGDGRGMWRLSIVSDGDLTAMSLLESPGGRLVNLSGGASPAQRPDEVHVVPYFPSASDALGRQGFVRIVNHSAEEATVRVQPRDDTKRRYEPLTLVLGPAEAAHLDSRDLELGNAAGGLLGSTGPGTGDWRLEIVSEPGVLVLPYVRAPGGSLVPMHHVVGASGRRHETTPLEDRR